jgi:hypothetical protein
MDFTIIPDGDCMERMREIREPQRMTATRRLVVGCLLLGVLAAPAAAVPITFSYTGGFQSLTLTDPGDYRIVAAGAAGGGWRGGFGARAEGIFTFNGTETLSIIVGGRGEVSSLGAGGGGGGGSFVFLPGSTPVPLVVGGGGGGQGTPDYYPEDYSFGRNASLTPSGTDGKGLPYPGVPGTGGAPGGTAGFGGTVSAWPSSDSSIGIRPDAGGGGGFYGPGQVGPFLPSVSTVFHNAAVDNNGDAAIATARGGIGGGVVADGGFGGGGSAGALGFVGGGGGGFSGGGAGGGANSETPNPGGGGGGSFVNAFFGGYIPNSTVLSLLTERENGFVTIEFLGRGGGAAAVPAPGGLAMLAVALLGFAAVRRRA